MTQHKASVCANRISTKPVYIVDIDGTIADISHRLHFIDGPKKDWNAFFDACVDDKPIEHMRRFLLDFRGSIIYVSGRSERIRDATTKWIVKHGFPIPRDLYMRSDGDYRADNIIKIELLARMRSEGFEPILAVDDRNQVVRAWRDAGIPCLQCADGDY